MWWSFRCPCSSSLSLNPSYPCIPFSRFERRGLLHGKRDPAASRLLRGEDATDCLQHKTTNLRIALSTTREIGSRFYCQGLDVHPGRRKDTCSTSATVVSLQEERPPPSRSDHNSDDKSQNLDRSDGRIRVLAGSSLLGRGEQLVRREDALSDEREIEGASGTGIKTALARDSNAVRYSKSSSTTITRKSPPCNQLEGGPLGHKLKNDATHGGDGEEDAMMVRVGGRMLFEGEGEKNRRTAKVVYLLDVMPLCYSGNRPSLSAFRKWMRLFLSEVAAEDPVIAVMDGEKGNRYRQQLLPRYKSGRRRYHYGVAAKSRLGGGRDGNNNDNNNNSNNIYRMLPCIQRFLHRCNIPLVRMEYIEADDVVATLAKQAVQAGIKVVVASPDMDFRQLLTTDVKLCLPVPELGRWSFYGLEHFRQQHGCNPSFELGLRSLLGDKSDNVPGLSEFDPRFGRKTAMKLMSTFGGSLESLLAAAAVRTVGKPYIQSALTQHASLLRTNLTVLTLRSDMPEVYLAEEWCYPRPAGSDDEAFSILEEELRHAGQHPAQGVNSRWTPNPSRNNASLHEKRQLQKTPQRTKEAIS